MDPPRPYVLFWRVLIAVTVGGVIGFGLGIQPGSVILTTVGGGALATVILVSAWRSSRQTGKPVWIDVLTAVVGGIALLIAVMASFGLLGLSLERRIVVVATCGQVFLLAVDRCAAGRSPNSRRQVIVVGHGGVLVGSGLVIGLLAFRPGAALLLYAIGFSLLLLHTFWMSQLDRSVVPPRPGTVSRHSEAILLLALVIANIAVTVTSLSIAVALSIPYTDETQLAATVAGVTTVVAFAMLIAPSSPPGRLNLLTGLNATVVQHAGIAIVMLNLGVIAVFFAVPGAFLWMLGLYFLLLSIGVGIEYLEVGYASRKPQPSAPPLPDGPLLTVVVSAAFEATVLPESLAHNLEALTGVPFVLVPAEKSTDGTVEIARMFQRAHPDRVRVVLGTTGSKAGDITDAWSAVKTPYALLLDADETVESEFVARGLKRLQANPGLGIIQGRKAAADPNENRLARFVSAERRYSTWVDHPFMDEVLDAGHFGGSSAIFRREVPLAVDGWRPEVLTEDIDLTLRLYLQTDWDVGYDPMMAAKESNPASLRALVQQRVRWARGWIQVTSSHWGDIIRARRRLGVRQTAGLSWLLFTSVSAPISVVFPAFALLWLVGLGPTLPRWFSLALALYLLPARAITFGYASLADPIIPAPSNPSSIVTGVIYAYLWVLFAWFIQLHSLYLEFVDAPQVWSITKKKRVTATAE